ncbi:hypothetical protein DFH11DRAFT_1631300 [Phellopilus nigrolimitatus]|nr:hypothetical protein DFH11DRAFT_1631300 [Phellopilus nigrolimitatus]
MTTPSPQQTIAARRALAFTEILLSLQLISNKNELRAALHDIAAGNCGDVHLYDLLGENAIHLHHVLDYFSPVDTAKEPTKARRVYRSKNRNPCQNCTTNKVRCVLVKGKNEARRFCERCESYGLECKAPSTPHENTMVAPRMYPEPSLDITSMMSGKLDDTCYPAYTQAHIENLAGTHVHNNSNWVGQPRHHSMFQAPLQTPFQMPPP